ncbi:conserved hypothetical protein [Leishmania mexicana MHOM/GT/2001/U1103]|uniref:Calponin-homology (CH) domain-containing protein n=1 Tax=Leishmania mexicana (strain MHOM/GT/2001/U1103) TaxID=929439 RepID=E9AS07_LEIMU|nr:conserved hypothetical protein [Leishmania mexicana MHOM/GT/2001/U1103]CBZ25728.1 conserved hypothetical protein [Leishmania mexicana MHOM/GT/2001/U1103]
MQREVIKWVQSLDLSAPIQNPKRDLATGHLAAEIVTHYSGTKYLDLQRLPTGAAGATKRDVWSQVYRALQQLSCTTVTQPLIDAVLRREPNAALTVLEYLYEHFTAHALPMHGLDAVGTSENLYVQPRNATSTARLLEVTSGKPNNNFNSVEEVTPNAKGKLFDPVTSASHLTCAGRSSSTADVRYSGQDTAADWSDACVDASGNDLTRAVQHRLALIDNSELAGGVNALQAYPRYARPTASTLVHTASGSRKDVVLDKPKYTADEVLQQQQNKRILQQHAVVQRLQEESQGATAEGPSHTLTGTSAMGATASSLPASPLREKAALHANRGAAEEAPLTALYRGRFYRQPDAPTVTGTAKVSTGPRKAKKGKREEVGAKAQRGATAASSKVHVIDVDGKLDRHAAAAPGDVLSTPEFAGSASGGGGTDGTRVVPVLRVNAHSASLQATLALRKDHAELQERAAALSVEYFAKHNYALRPGLSDILVDVLAAHKQLQRLLDCCAEDGNSEVLDNVLGHLLAHRDEFPPACIRACWQALVQHAHGIVALLQKNPDEYGYLTESLAFAFSREAAQVPLLHISQNVTVSGEADDAEQEERAAATTGGPLLLPFVGSTRRSIAFSKGIVAGAGHKAAAAASAARRCSTLPGADSTTEGDTASSRHKHSLSEALLTATHRAASVAAGSFNAPSAASLSSCQRAIIDTCDGLPVACAFGFLYSIARQLDLRTAAYVLERYVLRSAKPFLLRHGTVAVREAVARVVSASFMPPPPKNTAAAGDVKGDGEAVAATAADCEEAFAQFLTGNLARTLLGSVPTSCNTHCDAVSTPSRDSPDDSAAKHDTHNTHPLQLSLQRAYWLIVFHAVADYPGTADHGTAPSCGADGPLAACVRNAAVTCLSCTDADLLTIGVGLTIEYSKRWLPCDAPPIDAAIDDAVARALGPVSHVLPSLDGAADRLATPWWRTPSADTWECRLMVLRLCNTLLAHPLFSGAGLPEASVERRSDDGKTTSCNWRATVDVAAAECLSTFAKDSSWQLQLALGVAAKSIDQISAPTLTDTWRQLLCSIPVASLPTQLLPYNEAPVRLQLLRPLRSAASAREAAESDRSKGAQSSARLQQTWMSSCQNDRAAPLHGATSAFAGELESWTWTSAKENRDSWRSPGTGTAAPATAEAALRFVWGRVLSVYAVMPLNQTWNVQGVVDAVLPSLAGSGATTAAASSPAAPAMAPTLQLLVMAAALLSPPATATTAVSAAPSTASPYKLSSMSPGDAEPVDVGELSGAFWLAALRRAWPLFQACGVSHEPMNEGAETKIVEEAASSLDGVAVGRAGSVVNLEDLRTIVLSLFLRFADDDAVASAMAAADGDGANLCGSAIRWAEAMCGDAPATCAQ